MYLSRVSSDEIIIDESWTEEDHAIDLDGGTRGKGRIPRNYELAPLGFAGFMTPFDEELFPRNEWADRIEEYEANGTLANLAIDNGLKCKDQEQTNYCWANAPVHCVEIIRLYQGESLIYLSPASVAAPIKNYTNRGGWGTEALEFLIKYGAVPTMLWPDNAITRQYDNEESRAERSGFQVTEWWDIPPQRFAALITFMLRHKRPVAAGYNWWAHEVTLYDPVVIGANTFGMRFRNSWGMSYGDRGFGILTETKATPDDAVSPRAVVPHARVA